jgi:hypothetical protein
LGSDQYRAHWFIYVNFFRIGNFNDATKDVKDAWFHFCGNILPQLNKNWKSKVIQSNKLISDICTVSDEAYAYQIGKTNIHFWMKRLYYKQHQRFIDWQEFEPLNPKQLGNHRAGKQGIYQGRDAFKDGKHSIAAADDDDDDTEDVDDDDVVDNFEDAHDANEDEDAEINDDEDGYGAKKILQKKKHVDSENQNDSNNLEDREFGVELAKDKIDSKAYYACYHVLYNQKLSNLDDWTSWDTAYKNCVAMPKQQKKRTAPGVASSSLSSESKEQELIVDETHEIHFEKWC